ncbi:MAG: hypothetical protein NTW96_07475, partial [Planctomycetia bacterium]|nr:hypothetical protein [Planctomycetia bacterium]
MKDEPREDERIVEAIEAYRPGRDDPSDPALAPLVERLAADAELARKHQCLQRLDSVLSEAIRDVPVPEGLCQRILDRLDATAKVPETPGEVAVKDAPDAGEAVEVLPDRRAIARRRWLLSATAATVAASLAVGAFLALQPRGSYKEGDVLDVAVQFFDAPENETEASHELRGKDRLGVDGFPLGSEVAGVSVPRWRPISGFLGRQGVAYELTGPGGARATLYVVQCGGAVQGLGATPPSQPARTTGGRAAAAWQTGGL